MILSSSQKKISASLLLVACMNLFMGCNRFYKPVNVGGRSGQNSQTVIKDLNQAGKYFILRKGTESYSLSHIVIDPDKLALTANLGVVPEDHRLYIDHPNEFRYRKSRIEEVVLREVHLYVNDTAKLDSSKPYTTSLNNIQKIEVLEFDKAKTNRSYTGGTIIAVVATAGVIAIIAAIAHKPAPEPQPSTTGSCPYISTYNGKDYTLQGEIYSAAILPVLQKEDYLPIYASPVNGEYRLKISNDLPEVQHTDFADMVVVEHDKNVKVMMDPQGKVYTISAIQPLEKAMLNGREDVTNELLSKDNNSCLFKDINGGNSQDLYLTFKNNSTHPEAKLILNAKMSLWFNYVYDEFSKGFGNRYNKWAKDQNNKPASELEAWSDGQNIPLSVSIKTIEGWKEIQKIKPVGPLLNREMIIPLSDLPASGPVELKLSCGFMFWELDYAAIDFTKDDQLRIHNINPCKALDQAGVNVLPQLMSGDKKYLNQDHMGDAAILSYKEFDSNPGLTQTVFLHSSGYYDHPRDHAGTPKVAFLKSFSKPGAMSAFSRQKFLEAWNKLAAN